MQLDIDRNDKVNLSDVLGLLNYLFQGGAPPEPPFPKCDAAATYRLQMVGSDPSCGVRVGEQAIFQVLFSAPALSLFSLGGFP